jgi:DNA-binding NarL/FixJ family response regulator
METARPSKLRVLLVDDHRVVAYALARLIADEPDIAVVATIASVGEIERVRDTELDCALISYLLRDGSAAAARAVKRLMPHARVVVMSRLHDGRAATRMARAGADAFIAGDASAQDLFAALRGSSGGSVRSDAPAPAPARPSKADNLTPRELEVLRALCLGRSTAQMCTELGIGTNTVRTHVQNIIAKLRVHSRLEAVALAAREQLV